MTSQLKTKPEKVEVQRTTLFDRTFRDPEGNIVIAQLPNLPAIVATTAIILHLVLPASRLQAGIGLIGFGTAFTWAWLELFQGVNYFRQGLGLLTLIGLISFGFYIA